MVTTGKFVALLSVMTPVTVSAAVIGHMVPAEPITTARIAMLPAVERSAWSAYLAQSERLMAADRAALATERAGQSTPPPPPPSGPSGGAGMPLDRAAEWYAGPEARHVADNIVSFQTPAGGWGKNVDRTGPVRRPGQLWVPVEDLPANARTDMEPGWSYVGTIDNNATTTEIRFLARVGTSVPGPTGEPYRAAMLKGVRYLLAAQFPNGGWPQIYPLRGGYHDAITFNDDALTLVVTTLSSVAARAGDYAFVPAELAAQAQAACARATDVILRTQVVVDGKPTVWDQQHDALTLAPVGARNFEPAALSSDESAGLLLFLMKQPSPTPRTVAAIENGIGWLRAHAIPGYVWQRGGPDGRRLVATPGAPPIWSRFYDIRTGKPIFGDRDRTIHDDVGDLSAERRNGYSWYNAGPAKALTAYDRWRARRG